MSNRYTPGDHVRITGTQYAGQLGTIEGVTSSLVAIKLNATGHTVGIPADCIKRVTA